MIECVTSAVTGIPAVRVPAAPPRGLGAFAAVTGLELFAVTANCDNDGDMTR
jgi:hypothetical protein